jgi:adenylate cyclase
LEVCRPFAFALGLSPLLHRFGPLTAPLVLTAISYAWVFWLSLNGGIANGTAYFYFTTGALAVLLFGTRRPFLPLLVSGLAAALQLFLYLGVASRNATSYPTSPATFVMNVLGVYVILYFVVLYAVRELTRAEARAEREHRRSEALLSNILPPTIAEQLKEHPDIPIADAYSEASILFADMAGFTARARDLSPKDLVQFLNSVYTRLDRLVERHGLEKIKTTGDSYMVVSGVPEPRPDHVARLAGFALDLREAVSDLVDPNGRAAPMRIGIACGPVVAGIVGTRKFFYDVWGDAVNMASRMESTGVPGKIQVAADIHEVLTAEFEFEDRGIIDVRGKGATRTWFLIGRTPSINAR